MSDTTYPGLKPLLMPSGPQWAEQWTEQDPPPLVRYDYYRYTSRWADRVEDRHDTWADGAWLLVIDRGTRLGRLWWKHIVPAWCRALWAFGARRTVRRIGDRASAYPFGGVPMGWRFAIGPDLAPWEPGDQQPQDGHWPISIAVYGAERVAAADAIHTGRMRARLGGGPR